MLLSFYIERRAYMTVSNTVTKNVYTLNSSTTVFSYTFAISTDDGSDIHLYLTDNSGTVSSTTEITSGFTVDTDALTVTYSAASGYGSDYQLTLSREVPLTQEVDLENQGAFYAETHEEVFDKLTMIDQQQTEVLSRCIKYDISSSSTATSVNDIIEAATEAAGTYASAAAGSATTATEQATIATNAAATSTTKATTATEQAVIATTKAAEAEASAASISLPIPVASGGTGATTAAAARTNLGAAPSGYGLGTAAATATSDWNNYLTTGFFVGNNLTNAPTSGSTTWYYVIVIRYQDTYVYQRATGYGTAAFNSFERRCNAGTWSAWKRIATSSDFNFNDFRNVVSTVTSNTAATIAADYCPYTQASISLTLSMSTTGANAIDTGTVSASTWYYTYVIYNPTTNTVACLASTSSSSPTLPSGYTFYVRVGAILTNSSSYLYRIIQRGHRAQYIVDGTILTGMLRLASGASGTPATPGWTTVSTSSYVPSTAKSIDLALFGYGGTKVLVAPNSNYGGYNSTTNPPFASNFPYNNTNVSNVSILLESTNIYWASEGSSNFLGLTGWEENL